MSRPAAGPALGAAGMPRAASASTASQGALVRLAALGGLLALAAAGVAIYARVSSTMFVNSDDANTALQGYDIAHGNWLLHGWTLSGSPFYLVEVPVFAVVAAVRGLDPAVVHEASAIVYVAFLAIAGLLAAGDSRGRAAVIAAGITLTLLLAPAGFVVRFLLLGPYHLGTAAAIMAALLAIDRLSGRTRDLVVCAILTAASVSDPLTVWVGTLAIAGTLLLRLLLWRDRDEWPLLIAVAASAFLAQGTLHAVHRLGGFTTLPLPVTVATPEEALRSARYVVDGLQLLFGAQGLPASVPTAWSWLHLGLLLLALAAAGWAAIAYLAGQLDRTLQMAVAVIGLDVAATVVSAQSADIGALRYLMPAYGLLAVIAGRRFGPVLARPRAWVLAAALAAAQLVFLLGFDVTQPVAPSARASLESYLIAQNLRHGYGMYWDASSLTLETHGRVIVRAVNGAGGHVTPYLWESSRAWYSPGADGPATFVLEPLDGTGPDQASVFQAFGPPARQVVRAGYRIEIWNRDLAPLLGTT